MGRLCLAALHTLPLAHLHVLRLAPLKVLHPLALRLQPTQLFVRLLQGRSGLSLILSRLIQAQHGLCQGFLQLSQLLPAIQRDLLPRFHRQYGIRNLREL